MTTGRINQNSTTRYFESKQSRNAAAAAAGDKLLPNRPATANGTCPSKCQNHINVFHLPTSLFSQRRHRQQSSHFLSSLSNFSITMNQPAHLTSHTFHRRESHLISHDHTAARHRHFFISMRMHLLIRYVRRQRSEKKPFHM